MLSAEKMQTSINMKVAELIVEQLADSLKNELQEQWNKVISELVSTKKSNIQLEKAFDALIESNNRVIEFIETLQGQTQKTTDLQAKEERILDFLMQEFAIKPEGA